MTNYYSRKLSAKRLKQCYVIAPPRVQQYLEAEIEHILENVKPSDHILELGCGYGRVLKRLINYAELIVGIDTSLESLELAKKHIPETDTCELYQMDAINLEFGNEIFDVTFCIQNGISAFGVNQKKLIDEAIRVTRKEGKVLFSSYSEKLWDDRLKWFQLQSQNGLIGEIDYNKTSDGEIVCKDGFRATTVTFEGFKSLTENLNLPVYFTEIDESSIFCEIELK
jgi:2-polyprenyl-6-hydroxyphenyl methylase/3-demethylubiquinone-9 3-methyltransferase